MYRQYALVTGASRGIGAAIARELSKDLDGLFICSTEKSEEALMDVAEGIRNMNSLCRVFPVICDISLSSEVDELFEIVREYTYDQGLDFLVNNAGISCSKLLCDTSDEDWHRVIDTNLSSAFYCCRAAQKKMIEFQHGSILNISSMWGQVGASMEVAYSVSKAGLDGLTRALAKELAPSNIRVNALSLGVIDTSMNDNLSGEEKADLAEEIPMGRFGDAKEAARMAKSILTAPDYLTGQIIRMDGGFI